MCDLDKLGAVATLLGHLVDAWVGIMCVECRVFPSPTEWIVIG